MDTSNARLLGEHLQKPRLAARVSQSALARAAEVSRLRVVRAENGLTVLNLDESIRVLYFPLTS